MKTRRLGTQGLEVGAIGLGCMGMSDFYGPRDEAESIATIHRAPRPGRHDARHRRRLRPARERGARSAAPSAGRRREAVVVATKFGIVRGSDPTARGVNGRPEYVRSSCDASLKRLGLDTIDLYYQHRVDPKTPIEETVGAMAELVRAGKVRFSACPRPRPRPSAAPRPCTRSPPCRASTRCSRASTRRARSPRAASSASASWPTARWAAAS